MASSVDLPSKPAPATGSDSVDAEHGIQLGLLEAALNALDAGAAMAQELVDQLHGYTQMHFMSEQLLMRLSARPNYDGHLEEHEKLMQDMDEVRTLLQKADTVGAAARLQLHEQRLLDHICSWDRSISGPSA